MVENSLEYIKKYLKAINSVSFLEVRTDEGETILSIPAWIVASILVLSIWGWRNRRKRRA